MKSKNRRLANRLTIAFLLVGIVPLLLFIIVFAVTFQNTLVSLYEASQVAPVAIGRTYIAEYVNNIFHDLDILTLLTDPGAVDQDWVLEVQDVCTTSGERYPLISMVDLEGQELAHLENCQPVPADALKDRSKEEAFFRAKRGETFISNITFSVQNQPIATVSRSGKAVGNETVILIIQVNLSELWQLLDAVNVGQGGYFYVVDRRGNLIGYRDLAVVQQGLTLANYPSVAPLLVGTEGASGRYQGLTGEEVFGSSTLIPQTGWGLVLEQPIEELAKPFASLRTIFVILAVISGILAGLTGFFLAGRIVRPIQELSEAATAAGSGDLSVKVNIRSQDEIGVTAQAFNTMTSRLQELVGSLEERVAERTRALEASTEVSRRLSTILNQQQLVISVVEEIQNVFNYYHVHIYLFDSANENLVMAGGTGEAGQILLASGHKIARGRGLVGRAADTNQPVLVSNTTEAPDWLPNPLLPDTRSEVAVPIAVGERVLGVLDVQQNIIGGLGEQDITLLQSIASQVAIAVQNAQLYTRAQEQAENETLVNMIGQKIQSATSIEDVLKIAVRELGDVFSTQTSIQIGAVPQNGGDRSKL